MINNFYSANIRQSVEISIRMDEIKSEISRSSDKKNQGRTADQYSTADTYINKSTGMFLPISTSTRQSEVQTDTNFSNG